MRSKELKHWLFFLGIAAVIAIQSCSVRKEVTLAFYNVENLFDTKDNPDKIDEQYLPGGRYQWDGEKYNNKIDHLAEVISKLDNEGAPEVLGLCEVENKSVIKDLVRHRLLKDEHYKIVHYESPDARGIDVALMYNSYLFKKLDSRKVKLDLSEYDDTSRDILMVKFKAKLAEKTTIYVLVNHWPSRREGKATSEPKRVKAAKTLDGIRDDILKEEPNAHIVIMGDFNDEPFDKSIKETLATTVELDQVSQEKFYNPMGRLKQAGLGSYNFRGNWNMLDQIMVSGSLMDGAGLDYEMHSANIYSPEWLRQHGGKYEGYPLRTFGGRKYLNGYSDHFPVSIRLKYASN